MKAERVRVACRVCGRVFSAYEASVACRERLCPHRCYVRTLADLTERESER